MQLWPPQLLVTSCSLSSCWSSPSRHRDKGLFSGLSLPGPLSHLLTDRPAKSLLSGGLRVLSVKWGQDVFLTYFSLLLGGSKSHSDGNPDLVALPPGTYLLSVSPASRPVPFFFFPCSPPRSTGSHSGKPAPPPASAGCSRIAYHYRNEIVKLCIGPGSL